MPCVAFAACKSGSACFDGVIRRKAIEAALGLFENFFALSNICYSIAVSACVSSLAVDTDRLALCLNLSRAKVLACVD